MKRKILLLPLATNELAIYKYNLFSIAATEAGLALPLQLIGLLPCDMLKSDVSEK